MTATDSPESHTVLSVLRGAEAWLRGRGVEAPKRSAELLLCKVLGVDRMRLYLAHDRPLDPTERAAMRDLTARRGRHEPVAYLLGSWSFRGLELEVSPAVLIPRPETEELIDLALAVMPPGAQVVDLGTGSGAIAIALAAARPDLHVLATDVSRNALAIAQRNIARHGLEPRVQLAAGSWWAATVGHGPFDLVVGNPPYVDPALPELLAAEVRDHEPPLALFSDHGDGASCYRAIVAGLGTHLRPGGHLVLETGVGAASRALAVLQACPDLQDVELRQDLAGIDRFLLARRR
ncbi:MAG: peptide chain release factor N(5)-glutamine methyltransferase [Planctomycetes bacterium]|nr:peptide chain release factor N(5)-glutamine methyltransferase [Planctomycetota bacterium]